MAKRSLRRYTPEVGAECLNWARSDLCGGRSAMTVPTAIGEKARRQQQIIKLTEMHAALVWSGPSFNRCWASVSHHSGFALMHGAGAETSVPLCSDALPLYDRANATGFRRSLRQGEDFDASQRNRRARAHIMG